MNRRYRQIQIRTMNEPVSQPFKWLFAFAVFAMAMSFTFSDVGGDGVGNPYKGGYVDNAALDNIFVLPEATSLDGKATKVPTLLKRR